MLVAVIAVAVALVGKISVSGSAWLVLAYIFLATLTQGLYTAISEQWKDRYDPLLTVLVLEIAMVILMSLCCIWAT
jgi:drug/metabolite transporter (DMT)-like permease